MSDTIPANNILDLLKEEMEILSLEQQVRERKAALAKARQDILYPGDEVPDTKQSNAN